MDPVQKVEAVKTAIRDQAEWASMGVGGLLWSNVDNVELLREGKVAKARWRAKLVFDAPEGRGLHNTSIPPTISYEECIVELHQSGEDECLSYFVREWDVSPSDAVYMELSWDDERVTDEDIDQFCRWQDDETLLDELLDQFQTKEEVDLNLFPQRLRPLILRSLRSR